MIKGAEFMNTTYSKEDLRFVRIYHIVGIFVICIASFPLHFSYEWSGASAIIGIFTPINESIWEHLKLVFWPLLLWWGVGFLVYRESKHLNLTKWLTAMMVSVVLSMLIIVGWYYTWTSGLEIESSIIDIGSLFLAVPIAQLIAIHVYRVIEPKLVYLILSLFFLLILAGMFINFTFNTPNFPIFIPSN